MALIKCPECRKDISDKSKVCIHCGYPLISDNPNQNDEESVQHILPETAPTKKSTKMYVAIIGIAIAVAVTVFAFIKATEEPTSNLNNTIPNSTASTTTATEDSTSLLIAQSKDNMRPYFDVMGADITNGNPDVSQEFIDNLNSTNLMGYSGSISHGYNVYDGKTYIELLTWISNDEVSRKEFDEFIEQMNLYFDYEATPASFDHISDETWQWMDYDESCDAIAWYEDNRINISWDWVLTAVGQEIPTIEEQETANLPESSTDKHYQPCEVDDCTQTGYYEILGFSGRTEYYCYTHYKEIQDMIDNMLNEPAYGDCDNCGRPAEYAWDEDTAYCASCFESLLEYIYNN